MMPMNNVTLLLALLSVLSIFGCETKNKRDDDFHGMWQLDKFEAFDSRTGSWVLDSTRVGYTGYILYDGLGHMAVHLLPKGYKDFNTAKNIDSLNYTELKTLA